jgi:hypothetical protein
MISSARFLGGILAVAAVALPGCYATEDPAPVGYVETTAAPVDIETYPSVVYEGQPVYFYGDRWWHRDGRGWTYYRDEPGELRRQRSVVVRAPRGRGRVVPHEERREERHEERREERR